jgi:hypothetical protein
MQVKPVKLVEKLWMSADMYLTASRNDGRIIHAVLVDIPDLSHAVSIRHVVVQVLVKKRCKTAMLVMDRGSHTFAFCIDCLELRAEIDELDDYRTPTDHSKYR